MSSNSLLTQTHDIIRYANTYKLEPDNPFDPEKVEKVLKEILQEAMENLVYDPDQCVKQAKWASYTIRKKVKELNFDRYKIISIVTIGEKRDQSVNIVCQFLWDSSKDRFSTISIENSNVYGIAYCFGLYYE
ncbi:dynein light chain Tctex-type 5 [Diorhabda sublineata]|uniref:dynein light chain Tctex-type 5 n=1 Tax=Diorhabda sublineata TaxID=1163346 RepID=UPI0024E06C39|nr:dynein light chain Tctex-type 5 [Diorhabda sublineata]